MPKPFQGEIKLDVRDSTADWPAFLADKAPEGAPNVLVVLYDDTGCAAWSPYGGRINMPTMDRLAANGLTYSQWHTTALCSPTRSTFLTGRNHHLNGFATISESSTGFPGYNSHIPPENATMANILRDAGWSTFWVGKNHNVPIDEWTMGASKKNWPLGQGYDRFYGFIGGETNNWYPSLAEDNHYIDQPYLPEDGYHLSKDLADQALRMIRDSKQTEPDKPWYLWFCPGANHAPHHCPEDYIAKYKGVFDDGYEAYREWVLPRMIERGILPEGTELTPINPMPDGTFNPTDVVRPWDSLNDAEKAMFCRMAEVYAGFSEYTDAQVGRIVDYLEESGQLDNTIIFYCADNGASGEGSPERLGQRGQDLRRLPRRPRAEPDDGRPARQPEHVQPLPDGLGDGLLDAVPHVQALRRTRAACATRWSSTGRPASRPRARCATSTTTPPTSCRRSSTCAASRCPTSTTAPTAEPAVGRLDALLVRRRRRRRRPSTPSTTRCSATAASGTRAGRRSPSTARWRARASFDDDRWQLFHTDEDRAEAHDLADRAPRQARGAQGAVVRGGGGQQRPAAERPADHRQPEGLRDVRRDGVPHPGPTERAVHVLPGHERDPGALGGQRAQRVLQGARRGRADAADAEGVIFAHGSRFGGHALFIKDGKVTYAYNFLGIPPEDRISAPVPTSGPHIIGVEFTKERMGEHREGIGPAEAVHRRPASSPRPRSAPSWATSRCAARACASATTAPTRSSSMYALGVRVHRRRDHEGRVRHRRRRLRRRRSAPRRGDGEGLTRQGSGRGSSRPARLLPLGHGSSPGGAGPTMPAARSSDRATNPAAVIGTARNTPRKPARAAPAATDEGDHERMQLARPAPGSTAAARCPRGPARR